MKKTISLTVVGCLLLFLNAEAQDKEIPELFEKEFQFTFMTPPLSTNWIQNSKTVNKFSLNLFIGNAGAVDGVELGGFINSDNYYMNGFQGAGFGNVVGGNVDGAQLAGFFNISSGGMNGVQGAGFFNVSAGLTQGAQLAGFINVAESYKSGAQLAGFANVAGAGLINAQLGGFLNIAREVQGAQVAGFINVADHARGVQLAGFINICDSIDGIPIGFINIVRKNGYRHFDVSVSETQYFNFSYRMGVRQFHNIYSLGKPSGPGNRWLFGFGLGGEVDMEKNMTLNIEAICNQEFWIGESGTGNFLHIDRLNLLNQFRVLFGFHPNDKVCLFLGPTFNVAIAETNPDLGYFPWHEIGPTWAFYRHTYNNTGMTNVKLWFGFTAGVRL